MKLNCTPLYIYTTRKLIGEILYFIIMTKIIIILFIIIMTRIVRKLD